jgi:hypothetical protein
MTEPSCPKIQVDNTAGATLGIHFDHFDVSGDEWIETFKLIMVFLGYGSQTIRELFNDEQEELFNTEED